jgi:DNA (cytosine-5)-methyltransferase 1
MQQNIFSIENHNLHNNNLSFENIKFIDLFAGIGGFHQALSSLGMKCVFASEIDADARETYLKNHQIDEAIFNTDIRAIEPFDIPDHDILCAGFPCQPFSQMGYKKGFADGDRSERGNLFYSIWEILNTKRPKAYILENVRHLLNHDDGRTFSTIKKELEALDYSVAYKIIRASDFGRPQHRPRIYIVGFDKRQVNTLCNFEFPLPIPLKQTMSDVWEGKCDREIGFTLRVGGRGSPINDRRNWDAYRVDGEVKQLTPKEGKRMMGYPESFILPNNKTKAMKQLGNSVCVDVVKHVAQQVCNYLTLNKINLDESMKKFNKGEWSELYVFFKIILERNLNFCDKNGNLLKDYITVIELGHKNSNIRYSIDDRKVKFKSIDGSILSEAKLSDLISQEEISNVLKELKEAEGSSFHLLSANQLIDRFEIKKFKGNSGSKGDVNLSFMHDGITVENDPIGIKSDIGSPPTLLNASGATNFIFEVIGFTGSIDEVNSLNPLKGKIQERINKIETNGGRFKFVKLERQTHESNLRKIDSLMPEILSNALLRYYQGHGSAITDLIVDSQEIVRIKEYLKAVMLGMFPNKQWDGDYTANGAILCDNDGQLSILHVVKDSILKEYLLNNTKLDTPSSTRHRFGSLYNENGKLYMKLNLQIRMK